MASLEDATSPTTMSRVTSTATTTTTTATPSSLLPPPSFWASLVAGGMAGTTVDVALYPIDTIKTRLQAPGGFFKAGGFRGMYNGLSAVAIGSAPGAALFFATYEQSKQQLHHHQQQHLSLGTIHMLAASLGEVMACMVRVPTEVIKARMQTSSSSCKKMTTFMETIRQIYMEPRVASGGDGGSMSTGSFRNFYRGFGITLFREVPFAMIQFPLYERGKQLVCDLVMTSHDHSSSGRSSSDSNAGECPPLAAAACGSLSGAIAGALTTPLDVLKTRFMLGVDTTVTPTVNGTIVKPHRYTSVWDVLIRTLQSEGPRGLFHGLQPRVFWISLGGFVFFGAYETSLQWVGRPLFP